MITIDTLAEPLLAILLGYALGAIPFGLLLTRAAGLGDLRGIGSGNIGATNVLRTGRKGLAAATLLLDAGKGAAAVLVAGLLWPAMPHLAPLAGLMAFLGHLFPAWLGFRGGKGVATLAGVTLALAWPIGLVVVFAWIAILALTRISSVGGIAAGIAAPIAAWAIGRWDLIPLLGGCAVLLLWKHRANIARIARGAEPRIGASG